MKGDIPMNEKQFEILEELNENIQEQNELLKNIHFTIKWICIWIFFIAIFYIGKLIILFASGATAYSILESLTK